MPSLQVSSTEAFRYAPVSLRQRLIHLPFILRLVALAAAILALARPQTSNNWSSQNIEGIDIWGSLTPARAVGGDFYDFFVRDNQLFFCIGDVSGKGIPAALFMMMTRSLFRAYPNGETQPDRIVTKMNCDLSENNENCMFVTLLVGILDLTSGQLQYCNAGHEAPILIDKEAHLLPVISVYPAGINPNTHYETQTAVIEPHTSILLYTDGLTEAMDADRQQFGQERVFNEISLAIQAGEVSPKALIERLIQAVHDYVGDTEQSDDLTLLCLRT